MKTRWLQVLKPIAPRTQLVFGSMSFVLPILLWCLVSYVPFVWHPQILITQPGSVEYLEPGMRMNRQAFEDEVADAGNDDKAPPEGYPANPIYLPAPHEVAMALYTAFTTPPVSQDGQWLHQDGPKITIIVIGTLFQQVLIIANTTRKLDVALVEAALTLGTRNAKLLTRVVIPGILPDLYRDQRILLGWAWTYLIVAELIGTTSGITWFITLQARYQHFANVYAAIMMIGIIGLGTDMVLALLGRWLFPWDRSLAKTA